jgi:adenine-specific DNA-methyltransferase
VVLLVLQRRFEVVAVRRWRSCSCSFGAAPGQEEPVRPARQICPVLLESPDYLARQLITYIGNKRALLPLIGGAVETVRRRTGREQLRILDAFSGSGVVSRLLKQHARELVVNDIEDYARAISQCYLTNRHTVSMATLTAVVAELNREVDGHRAPRGFIQRLYAPRDAARIEAHERVFYTPENAYRLDGYRQLLEHQPPAVKTLLMGPLLSAASIHANTAGVFKGFYKDRATGIGKLGGTGADALPRITTPIVLRPPVLSRFACDHLVCQKDANALVRELGDFDVAYFDPPYNQHPYGSNYFMLNLLVNYREPAELSPVSGIPAGWQRSGYNSRSKALPLLRDLVADVDARFVILSFNDDGFVAPEELREALEAVGDVTEQSQEHATFRGARNLRNRGTRVREHVYLIEKR